jgi:hypothetical protein
VSRNGTQRPTVIQINRSELLNHLLDVQALADEATAHGTAAMHAAYHLREYEIASMLNRQLQLLGEWRRDSRRLVGWLDGLPEADEPVESAVRAFEIAPLRVAAGNGTRRK